MADSLPGSLPSPISTWRRSPARARWALGWGLLFLAGFQFVLVLGLERRRPDLRDPEFAYRLESLRRHQVEMPGRPLVVVLGNSRAATGFRPDVLTECRPVNGPAPLVFNFACVGGGPVLDMLTLHRLLADGVRPEWVVLEYWPPFMHGASVHAEDSSVDPNRLAWSEVKLLSRISNHPAQLYRRWGEVRVLPWYSTRFLLLDHYLPAWLSWEARVPEWRWQGLDTWGWLQPRVTTMASDERARRIEECRGLFGVILRDFCLAGQADRALRECLTLCRREHVGVVLLFMPEAAVFQSWYPPHVRAQMDEHLRCLGRDFDVSVIDTRDWLIDADFSDGFHLLPAGAQTFTERFGHEVLVPLMEGRLRAAARR